VLADPVLADPVLPEPELLDLDLAAGAGDDFSDSLLELPVDVEPDREEDPAADPPERAEPVADEPVCVDPGRVKAMTPPATTLAKPIPAVVVRSRLRACSRATTARRTSLWRALIRLPLLRCGCPRRAPLPRASRREF
jgi:hypothetical protein